MPLQLPKGLRAAGTALIALALAGATLVIVRATRVLHQAQQAVQSEHEIRFAVRRLPDPARSPFEFFRSPENSQQAVVFDGRVFLAGKLGLVELDEAGSVQHQYLVGRELPPSPVVAATTAKLEDAASSELILASASAGILAFDGHSFRQILPERAEARAVTAIAATNSGHLLMGTRKLGVLVYDGKRITPLHSTLGGLDVTTLTGDDIDLWIGTLSQGVFHYHAGRTEHFAESDGLPDPQVLSITSEGEVTFVGTPLGVAMFNAGRFSRVIAPGLFASSLLVQGSVLYVGTEDQGIFSILLGASRPNASGDHTMAGSEIRQIIAMNGSIFAVGREGLFRRPPHASGWQRVWQPSQTVLSDRNISALTWDKDGRLWIGYFDRGLDILATDRSRSVHVEDEHVFCVNRILVDDKSDAVEVATANGLVRMNKSGSVQQVLTRADGLIADHVTDVVLYRDGLALATPAGLTFMDASGARSLYAFQGLVNNHVYALGVDGDELLAGTLGGISQLDRASVARNLTTATSNLKHNWITAIVPVDGAWMIGTYGAGILGLDRDGTFQKFETASEPFEVNPNAMLLTAQHVFAGSLGRGLYVYDRATLRWRVLDQGLPSLNVTAIAAGGGYVYIGTDNGLVRIAEQNLHP